MGPIFIVLIFCITFISIRYLALIAKFYRCSKLFPGQSGFALIKNILEFRNKDVVFDKLAILRETYPSPMSIWLGPKFFLLFGKPAQLEVILNSKACLDKSSIYKFMDKIIGSGLFNSSGEKWARHRKLLNPTMSHKVLMTYFTFFNAESNTLVENLETMVGKSDFNIHNLIEKCVFDITSCTTAGTSLKTQNGHDSKLAEVLHWGKEIVALRILTLPYYSDFLFRFSKWYQIQLKAIEIAEISFNDIVKQKISGKVNVQNECNVSDERNSRINENFKNSFMDLALNIAATHKDFDLNNVKENLYAFYVAAVATTTIAVSNIIFCLAAHSECQQRVIEEINELFPDKDCEITFEDTRKMVYTEMVINEVLRLFPSTPMIGRFVSEDFYFDQKLIPKDTEIIIDIFYLHRDKDIWGPNCNKFYPEHFLPRNVAEMHPYQFIPFSKGPRNCIGWRYAYLSMKVMIAKIFQNFRFTTDLKLEDMKFQMDVTLKAINQPFVRIHKLENYNSHN